MYAKKYSLNTNFQIKSRREKKCKIKIIDFIKIHQDKFIGKSLPSSYIVAKLELSDRDIYECLHELFSDGVLGKKYFSICPVCYSENILDLNDNSVKCEFCGENYILDEIQEKFILLLNNKEE